MFKNLKYRIISYLYHSIKEFEFKNINNSIRETPAQVNENFKFGDYFTFNKINNDYTLKIEDGVTFRKYCNILLFPKAHLHIHKNVFFNNYCSINCLGRISIGENSMFGEGVKIYDHNHQHKIIEGTLFIEKTEFNIGHVTIGKNCWIGSNVTILNGVEIGDNVLIGANCLIYKSVPSNMIVKAKAEYN